jgi:hypothetical protein
MTILTPAVVMAASVVLAVMSWTLAFAGGDDYEASMDKEGKGPAYFGFVRDHRGSAVPGAKVVLQPKVGEPVVLKTNAIGLYRSHISKDVNPAEVEVSCEKAGYRQARVARRSAAGAANIETDCTLRRL